MNPAAVTTVVARLTDMADAVERDLKIAADETTPINECITLFLQADRALDSIEAEVKRMNAVVRQYREQLIPQRLSDAGLQNLRMADGTQIVPQTGLRASLVSGKKEEAINWLRENDLADIVQETVNASTLSALAKKMAEDNRELPEELFNQYIYTTTSVRAGKASK